MAPNWLKTILVCQFFSEKKNSQEGGGLDFLGIFRGTFEWGDLSLFVMWGDLKLWGDLIWLGGLTPLYIPCRINTGLKRKNDTIGHNWLI